MHGDSAKEADCCRSRLLGNAKLWATAPLHDVYSLGSWLLCKAPADGHWVKSCCWSGTCTGLCTGPMLVTPVGCRELGHMSGTSTYPLDSSTVHVQVLGCCHLMLQLLNCCLLCRAYYLQHIKIRPDQFVVHNLRWCRQWVT